MGLYNILFYIGLDNIIHIIISWWIVYISGIFIIIVATDLVLNKKIKQKIRHYSFIGLIILSIPTALIFSDLIEKNKINNKNIIIENNDSYNNLYISIKKNVIETINSYNFWNDLENIFIGILATILSTRLLSRKKRNRKND